MSLHRLSWTTALALLACATGCGDHLLCHDRCRDCAYQLPCHGYSPTCWRPWPVECEACPSPFEVFPSSQELLEERPQAAPLPPRQPARDDGADGDDVSKPMPRGGEPEGAADDAPLPTPPGFPPSRPSRPMIDPSLEGPEGGERGSGVRDDLKPPSLPMPAPAPRDTRYRPRSAGPQRRVSAASPGVVDPLAVRASQPVAPRPIAPQPVVPRAVSAMPVAVRPPSTISGAPTAATPLTATPVAVRGLSQGSAAPQASPPRAVPIMPITARPTSPITVVTATPVAAKGVPQTQVPQTQVPQARKSPAPMGTVQVVPVPRRNPTVVPTSATRAAATPTSFQQWLNGN